MYEERPRTSCPLRLLVLQGNSSGQKHCDIKSDCEKIYLIRIARFSSPERVVQWQDIPGKGHHWRRRRRSQLPGRHTGTFQIRNCCFLESFSIESIGGSWKSRRMQLPRRKSNNSEARHSSEARGGNILVSVFLC